MSVIDLNDITPEHQERRLDLMYAIGETECDVQLARIMCAPTREAFKQYDLALLEPFLALIKASQGFEGFVAGPIVGPNDVVKCPHCKKEWTQAEQQALLVDRDSVHTPTCPYAKWMIAQRAAANAYNRIRVAKP